MECTHNYVARLGTEWICANSDCALRFIPKPEEECKHPIDKLRYGFPNPGRYCSACGEKSDDENQPENPQGKGDGKPLNKEWEMALEYERQELEARRRKDEMEAKPFPAREAFAALIDYLSLPNLGHRGAHLQYGHLEERLKDLRKRFLSE